jgi:hypothetical protein
MFNPVFNISPFVIGHIHDENDLLPNEPQQFEDIAEDPCDVEQYLTNEYDIKAIADKISSKLVKIVEQQLHSQANA